MKLLTTRTNLERKVVYFFHLCTNFNFFKHIENYLQFLNCNYRARQKQRKTKFSPSKQLCTHIVKLTPILVNGTPSLSSVDLLWIGSNINMATVNNSLIDSKITELVLNILLTAMQNTFSFLVLLHTQTQENLEEWCVNQECLWIINMQIIWTVKVKWIILPLP